MGKKVEIAPIGWVLGENGCHICTSHCLWYKKRGYYAYTVNGVKYKMHRYLYSKHYLDGGEIPKGLVVRHKCDNSLCINPKHLELGTQGDNIRDMIERGRFRSSKGCDNPKSKLSEQDVLYIYNSTESIKSLCGKFGIGSSQINLIRNNRSWQHITNGLPKKSGHGRRLSKEDVVDVFYSKENRKVISEKYGINKDQVWKIKTKQAWKEITKDL